MKVGSRLRFALTSSPCKDLLDSRTVPRALAFCVGRLTLLLPLLVRSGAVGLAGYSDTPRITRRRLKSERAPTC